MPQPKSEGAGEGSGAKPPSTRSRSTRSSAAPSSGATRSGRSTSGSASSSRSASRPRATSSARSASGARSTSSPRAPQQSASADAPDARLEALADRLRKLNERIIRAGKETGETTLSSYEKALKAIANAVERGPGSSDVDWIANLATTQAKFIRDVTTAWTSAAREMLK